MKNLKNLLLTATMIVLFTFTTKTSLSQDYYQAIGYVQSLGYFRYQATLTSGYLFDGIGIPFTSNGLYKATYTFNDHFAVSAYPSAGISLYFDEYSDYISFGAEIPVTGEFFIGDLDDYSFYLGAGLCAGYMNANDFGGFYFGPHLGIGGQYYWLGNLYGLRLSYTYGINKTRTNLPVETVLEDSKKIFSLSVYYPI